jgi:PAS domain S-box-containing protein
LKWVDQIPSGRKGVALVVLAELLLLALLSGGIYAEWRATNGAIQELSELVNPSPYRAALMGHLGKIHLSLQGYLRSADPSLSEQALKASGEFEASIPEFQKENPKLFPKQAVEEIGRTFDLFKQAVTHTLDANARRQSARKSLEENFAMIFQSMSQQIRPLIRDSQPDAKERREAALNVENQARKWQQHLSQAWSEFSKGSPETSFESDDRGSSYVEQYLRLDLLSRERKVLKDVRALWQQNSEIARGSFALEKVVLDAETFMKAQREQVAHSLNKYLPALSPRDLEKQKKRYILKMRLHGAVAVLFGLLGIASLFVFVTALSRLRRKTAYRPPASTKGEAPMMRMSLKGIITGWSDESQQVYGYEEDEILGESISLLFESEEDIGRLSKELSWAAHTSFESMHKSKDGALFRVRIEFYPITDAKDKVVAIGLHAKKK